MLGLPLPDYRKTLLVGDAVNSDIIWGIHSYFKAAKDQTKEFARRFAGGSIEDQCFRVWKYVRESIRYKRDPFDAQLIRMPSRFVFDAEGDCKSYSLFIASVLSNLGIPVSFRYASYRKSDSTPSHVYVVARDTDGKKIIVDGVYHLFNDEKSPEYYKDYPMNVYALSGVDGIGRRKKGKRKFGFFKGVKKLALAVPRRSFRTLVAINLHGLATKLSKAVAKNPDAVKSKWEKLGGKYPQLLQSINKGKKRKRILGINGVEPVMDMGAAETIGAAPALAAVIAAATPIVAAIAPLLKRSGADGAGGAGSVDDLLQKGGDLVKAAGGNVDVATADPTSGETPVPVDAEAGKDDTPGGFSLNPKILMIGGAVALGAFLLFGKKRR